MRDIIGPQADIMRSIAGPQSAIAEDISRQQEAKSGSGVCSSPPFSLVSRVMIALLCWEPAGSVLPL
jgi:hypothetical protein